MVKQMVSFAARPEVSDRVVFLEDYDIDLAQHLQPGVDVWINTPLRPNEACGTSGMKLMQRWHTKKMGGYGQGQHGPSYTQVQ
jgi:glycogen phosphorylase